MLGAVPLLLRTPSWRAQEQLYFYLTYNYTFVGGWGEGKGKEPDKPALDSAGRDRIWTKSSYQQSHREWQKFIYSYVHLVLYIV